MFRRVRRVYRRRGGVYVRRPHSALQEDAAAHAQGQQGQVPGGHPRPAGGAPAGLLQPGAARHSRVLHQRDHGPLGGQAGGHLRGVQEGAGRLRPEVAHVGR